MTDRRYFQSSGAGQAQIYMEAFHAPYTADNAVVFNSFGRAVASCIDDRTAHNIVATLNAVAKALTKRKT